MAPDSKLTLSSTETGQLNRVLAAAPPHLKRRARIVLLANRGLPTGQIAASVGLPEWLVTWWLSAFQEKRMNLFNDPNIEEPTSPPEPDEAQPMAEADQEDVPPNLMTRHPPSAASALAGIQPAEPRPPQPPPHRPVPGVDEPRRPLKLAAAPGVLPDDPMSEAGRKVLVFHFERMLQNEPGSRLGEDIEAVHDMRVATRRMRSALRIFEPFYKSKAIKPYARGLRDTARALGAVRDMDVFIEKLAGYRATLSDEQNDSLQPLLEHCIIEQKKHRGKLLAYLNSPEYTAFVDSFGEFLTQPGAGARKHKPGSPQAYQVRHVIPRLIYTNYENVRAYETVLDHARIETLHALRIEFKRLRYALEYFVEVLGPEGQNVVNEVKIMQDHLGDLNDAEVAGNFLASFVNRFERSQAEVMIMERRSIEQVFQYMAYQVSEKHRLLTTFPAAWAHFNRPEVRRDLALAVSIL